MLRFVSTFIALILLVLLVGASLKLWFLVNLVVVFGLTILFFTGLEVLLVSGQRVSFRRELLRGVLLFILREVWVFVGILGRFLYIMRAGGVGVGFRRSVDLNGDGVAVALLSSRLLLSSGVSLTVVHSNYCFRRRGRIF